MQKSIYLLFVFLLVSCGPVTPIAVASTKLPIIEFKKPNIFDQTIFDQMQDYDFDLNVGIFAVDKNLLFLFGSIGELDDWPIQSTLLRSEDGGNHWTEVMEPQQISKVIAFQMLKTGKGWALIEIIHTGEGPAALFHTTDFGKSWQKVSEIHKDTYLGFPGLMYFANETEGQLDIIYPYEMPQGYITHLSTYDSGKTWQETGRYAPTFEKEWAQANVTGAYAFWYRKDYDESVSLDGRSLWRVVTNNEEVIISRKLPEPEEDVTGFVTWQDWETITVLPLHLKYEKERIEVP
jgi:hypothetical protein